MDRRKQNRARAEFDELWDMLIALDPIFSTVLLRGTHSTGTRKHLPDGKPELKTPPPAYKDETGETAISVELNDPVERSVLAMAEHIRHALNIAKVVLEITPADVAERAMRTVPNCLACGDPCHGGVRSGMDDKCRQRWARAGRPDRSEFIAKIKREREANDDSKNT